MRNKIVIALLTILLLGFMGFVGAGYYFVHYVAQPEKVRTIILKSLKEQFPHAKHSLGAIEYSLFPGLHFTLTKLEMSLEKDGTKLAKLKDIVIDIPFFNILKGGGRFLVKIDSPEINYVQFKKKNNWTLAMKQLKSVIAKPTAKKQKSGKQAHVDQSEKSKKITIPAFVAQSFLDVHIKHAKVTYSVSQSKGEFDIEKFALKKVGLVGESAFEMVSKVDMQIGERSIKLEPILIGTFNLNQVLYSDSIKIPLDLKISGLKIQPDNWNFPLITNRIVVQVEKSGKIQGEYSFQMKEANSFKVHFNLEKELTKITNLDARFRIKDFVDILQLKTPDLTFGKSELKMNGAITLAAKKISPILKLELTPGVEYSLMGENIKFRSAVKINSKRVSINSRAELFQGEVHFLANRTLPSDLTKVMEDQSPVNANVKVKNLKVSKAWLDKNIQQASTRKTTTKESSEVAPVQKRTTKNKKKAESKLFLLPFSLSLDISDSYLDKTLLGAECRAKLQGKKHRIHDCVFKIDNGSIDIKESGTITPRLITSLMKTEMKKLNISSMQSFVPEKMGKVSGAADLNATLNAKIKSDTLNYKGSYRAKVIDGDVEKLPLVKWVEGYLSNVTLLKAVQKKKVNLTNAFKLVESKGKFSDKKIDISEFVFVGLKNKLTVKGQGSIYPFEQTKGNSSFAGTWQDRAGLISSFLKKQVGTIVLPFRLAGPNLAMVPDYGYTVKKLGKAVQKKVTRKIKIKAKNKIEKVIKKKLGKKADKILKNKKVKKLLKGLFD